MKKNILLYLIIIIFLITIFNCVIWDTGIPATTLTDEKVQGAWIHSTGDYTLRINQSSIFVKYLTDVETSYRTEFSYADDNTSTDVIKGTLALFDYKENFEAVTFDIVLTVANDPADNILEILNLEYVEGYDYTNTVPKEGIYLI